MIGGIVKGLDLERLLRLSNPWSVPMPSSNTQGDTPLRPTRSSLFMKESTMAPGKKDKKTFWSHGSWEMFFFVLESCEHEVLMGMFQTYRDDSLAWRNRCRIRLSKDLWLFKAHWTMLQRFIHLAKLAISKISMDAKENVQSQTPKKKHFDPKKIGQPFF